MRSILNLIFASLALSVVLANKLEHHNVITELAEIRSELHEGADFKPTERNFA